MLIRSHKNMSFLKQWAAFLFKLLSAVFIGLLLSVIGQALINYSYFSFVFVFLTVSFAFFSLVKKMGFLGVLLVDAVFVLIILLIKVYIVIANSG